MLEAGTPDCVLVVIGLLGRLPLIAMNVGVAEFCRSPCTLLVGTELAITPPDKRINTSFEDLIGDNLPSKQVSFGLPVWDISRNILQCVRLRAQAGYGGRQCVEDAHDPTLQFEMEPDARRATGRNWAQQCKLQARQKILDIQYAFASPVAIALPGKFCRAQIVSLF